MKRIVYFSILLLPFFWFLIDSCGPESKTQKGQHALTPIHILKNYQIVWEDHFDGTTLNTSKWKYGNVGKPCGKYATGSIKNILLDGKGFLLIKITKDGEGKYYTARLQGRFETTYGYFECRAAMNRQLGPEAAFRLHSTDFGKTLDPGKDGTMISVFQYHRMTPDKLSHAVYWNGYEANSQKINKQIHLKGIDTGFHTFGLEWTQKEYIFYVDGKETWRTSAAVSQHEEHVILLADLAGWGGDPAQGNFPDAVTFDYVKIYKPK